MCYFTGCPKRGTYQFPGVMAGLFCKKHAENGMIDIKHKRCEHEGCNKINPVFDIKGGKGRFCTVHKLSGMTDIKSKRCEHEGCTIRPNFDIKGGKGRFCAIHKLDGMIDVKHKTCEHEGCTIRPYFDIIGGKGRFCADHKQDCMVNMKDRQCEHDGCNRRPLYDFEGGKGRFCRDHILNGMVNIKSKRCEHIGCTTQPAYDINGGKGRFCADHKMDGMVDVITRKCEHDGCIRRPLYNFEGGKGRFCRDHKFDGMVDVKNKRCTICPTLINNKYNGYCYRCFIHTFPDNTIVRNHKTKERAVTEYLREQFSQYDIKLDKRIEYGCSTRRPDIFMDFGNHVIVIEIDENQHKEYDCSCENKRLMELFQDAGSRQMTVIRFNPDQYINDKQQSISSCWAITKDRGLYTVKRTKKNEWEMRLSTLKKHINFIIDNGNDKELNVIHLFYDGWSL